MKELIATKGLPASGKSSWAKGMGLGYKIINKDQLRAMLDNGKWSKANEKFIIEARNQLIVAALKEGHSVIVDDTNLAPKHIVDLGLIAQSNGAEFQVKDFTDVSVEECLERDRKRANYVGEQVILRMYHQYLKPKVQPPAYDPKLLNIVICDIDGTIAKMNGRGPFEWSKVGEDLPRHNIIRMVLNCCDEEDAALIFVSGRDSCCFQDTADWLHKHVNYRTSDIETYLHMRPQGDQRKDYIVKKEIYDKEIKGRFNVVAVFDDRPQVLRLWQALGFTDRIFNVGDGTEF